MCFCYTVLINDNINTMPIFQCATVLCGSKSTTICFAFAFYLKNLCTISLKSFVSSVHAVNSLGTTDFLLKATHETSLWILSGVNKSFLVLRDSYEL